MQPQNIVASPVRFALSLVPRPNRIRELRGMRALTRADLGAELGVSEQTVASWESNEEEIPREHRPLLAALIRGYQAVLRLRILPELGRAKLSEITRNDLQDLVDRLVATGLSASTVGVTLLPLRAIYKRAIARGEIAVNPTTGLEMPAVRGGRDRIAAPD